MLRKTNNWKKGKKRETKTINLRQTDKQTDKQTENHTDIKR